MGNRRPCHLQMGKAGAAQALNNRSPAPEAILRVRHESGSSFGPPFPYPENKHIGQVQPQAHSTQAIPILRNKNQRMVKVWCTKSL